jgi:ABC-2 type transport system permease protein
MVQWSILYRKEMLEMWRNMKWLWVPVVFILLGSMQPVTTYYLPQILESAGGLPEGAVIEIPTPTAGQVMAEVLGQYGSLGVLVLVLAGMGIVAGEKQSRSASLIMVRPVSYASFITAKWMSLITLAFASLFAGCLAGWYYTNLLIGDVNASYFLMGVLVYACWLAFILTVTVLMSTLMKGNSAIAFVTILVAAGLSITTSLFAKYMVWSPANLTGHASALLAEGRSGDWFGTSLIVTGAVIAILLVVSVRAFKGQELAD